MNILFVSSGNSKNGISPLTKNQGISLQKLGHQVTFYTIKGKGLKGYYKNIFKLKQFLKDKEYDVIHAHYSLSGMVAALAGAQPLVVSLMGSDVKASKFLKYLIQFFKKFYWKKVIVKSKDMKQASGLKDAFVIPNGVDFEKFRPISKKESLEVTGWDTSKKHILFAANPKRKEKNFDLAKEAFDQLNLAEAELKTLVDIPNDQVAYYFNASDVILLTSLWEGSPNVIKEAMACNCKIVAVNVGDIKKVISQTQGCFVTSFEAKEVSEKIHQALALEPKTNGSTYIEHLKSETIAHKIINIYKDCLHD